MQCEHKKRDGKRCGARALIGQKRCAIHSQPGRAAELGSRGGRRRTVYSSAGDLKDFKAPRLRPIFVNCWLNRLSKFVLEDWIPRSPMRLAISGRATCALLRCQTSKSDWRILSITSRRRSAPCFD
jgi:hypothetical protein